MMDYNTQENKFLRGFIGLIILSIIIGLVSKTRTGHVIVYDSVMLVIILILLTQGKTIAGYISQTSNIWSV